MWYINVTNVAGEPGQIHVDCEGDEDEAFFQLGFTLPEVSEICWVCGEVGDGSKTFRPEATPIRTLDEAKKFYDIGVMDLEITLDELNEDCEDMSDDDLLKLEHNQLNNDGPNRIHDATHVGGGKVCATVELILVRPKEVDEENLGGAVGDVIDDAVCRFDSMYCSLDSRLSDRYDDMTAFDEDALESVGRWLLGEDVPEVRE